MKLICTIHCACFSMLKKNETDDCRGFEEPGECSEGKGSVIFVGCESLPRMASCDDKALERAALINSL